MILCGAVARFIYTWKIRNPVKPYSTVVDYSLATIMISTTLAGSQIGAAFVLKLFPSLVI